MLQKLAPPLSRTVPEVAEAEGISTASLYNWRRQARERGEVLSSRGSTPERWSGEEKLRAVLDTAPMLQAEFSAYCREKGVYPKRVEAWRDGCMNANAKAAEQDKHSRQERKVEQKRVKELEREHLAAQDKPLILHSDNGSPMKASTFLQKLYDLGITSSRSRPRVSNDNAYSEALFRTSRYRPGFPSKGFATLDQAREWMLGFVHWYNEEHRHSALNYVTPEQRHSGDATRSLARRRATYEQARDAHPERRPGPIRDFGLPESVTLNPETVAEC